MMLRPGRFGAMMVVVVVAAVVGWLGLSLQVTAAEKKVDVQPSQLPDKIKRAIAQAVPNGQIIRIRQEVEGEDPGQYDVDIRAEGKKYEVEISPEGEVVEVKEREPKEHAMSPLSGKKWTEAFDLEHCTFSTVGRNRFFILEPKHQLVLAGRKEKVTITVLDETKKIGNVETRVVEEREEQGGKLKEVSRNFFAICKEHGDVFYFGEEVDEYKDGKLVNHSGAWRADEKDSRAGLMMPGTVLLGSRYYQEIAPAAKDRAEHVADDVTLETPAGTFKNCLKVEETTPLEPDEREYKVYAAGVGVVQDEDLKLTSYRPAK